MVKASYFLYLLALIFAPLAFGTCETWSITFMEVTVFTATALFLLDAFRNGRTLLKVPGLSCLVILPLYYLVQIMPLPGEVIKLLSPATYKLYQNTIGLFSPLDWLALSLDRKATLNEFFRFSAYGAIYFLTVQFSVSPGRFLKTITFLVYTAGFVAILALIQKATANGLIYWFRETPGDTQMGPYIYHNHFAGYMEMVLPLTLGLFMMTRSKGIKLASIRERFVDFFNKPELKTHFFTGIIAVFIAISIFASLSRGGIASTGIALFFLLTILSLKGLITGQRLTLFLVPLITLIFIGWFGFDQILDRFLAINTPDGIHDSRLDIWQQTMPMLGNFWFTGSGAGSFESTFPAFQTLRISHHLYDHAHNDYLELFCTTGLIGTLIVSCFLIIIISSSIKSVNRRRDHQAIYLWASCLSGMAAIFIHSFTDFNFYNRANTLYFFTICGLLVSAANSRIMANSESLLPHYRGTRKQLLLPLVAICLLLSVSLFFNTRSMAASSHFNAIKDISLNKNIPQGKLLSFKNRADAAVQLDPMTARNFYLQANITAYLGNFEEASTAYRRAIMLLPLKGEYLQQYGYHMNTVKENNGAEALIRAAIIVNPVKADIHLNYGNWLLSEGKIEKGLAELKSGFDLTPRKLTRQLTFMAVSKYKAKDMQAILPDEINYHFNLANFLEQLGRTNGATEVYRLIESEVETKKMLSVENYLTIMNYYIRNNLFTDASRLARQAVSEFPDDHRTLIMQGNLLNRQGHSDEAEKAFQQAITLAPTELSPRLSFASFLATSKRAPEARLQYQQAAKNLAEARDVNARNVRVIYNYFINQNEYEAAFAVLDSGISASPNDLYLRILLGDAYMRAGRKLDAQNEYLWVLARNPDNLEAQDRLWELGISR